MAKTKIQKTAGSEKNTTLKIFGGILLIAMLSFVILAGVKMLNHKERHEDVASEENKNTAEIVDNNEKAPPVDENNTTPGNEAKAKTDELEKEQKKEVEKNENGLRKAVVLLNEPYVADSKTIISSTITNVVETEGVCNYVFTNGTTSITKTTAVLPNAKNTVCEAVVLEKGSLSTGQWTVRLEYKSNLSEGVSETQTFTIQ